MISAMCSAASHLMVRSGLGEIAALELVVLQLGELVGRRCVCRDGHEGSAMMKSWCRKLTIAPQLCARQSSYSDVRIMVTEGQEMVYLCASSGASCAEGMHILQLECPVQQAAYSSERDFCYTVHTASSRENLTKLRGITRICLLIVLPGIHQSEATKPCSICTRLELSWPRRPLGRVADPGAAPCTNAPLSSPPQAAAACCKTP